MNKMITNKDLAVLAQQESETLAQWWCDLNRFEWPEELPDPEPPQFVHGSRRSKIMGWIMESVGHRFCNRVWNSHMTDGEHNDFWRGNFEGHKESRERHERRSLDMFERKLGNLRRR